MRSRTVLLLGGVLLTLLFAGVPMLAGQGTPPAPNPGRGRGAPPPPPEPQAGHPSGKLVIWGDLADMSRPGTPLRCFNTNRFHRGQRAGFRMTAIERRVIALTSSLAENYTPERLSGNIPAG